MSKFLTATALSFLAYLGTFLVLGSIMPNDWRVFFVSLLPIVAVLWLVYGREEETK